MIRAMSMAAKADGCIDAARRIARPGHLDNLGPQERRFVEPVPPAIFRITLRSSPGSSLPRCRPSTSTAWLNGRSRKSCRIRSGWKTDPGEDTVDRGTPSCT